MKSLLIYGPSSIGHHPGDDEKYDDGPSAAGHGQASAVIMVGVDSAEPGYTLVMPY